MGVSSKHFILIIVVDFHNKRTLQNLVPILLNKVGLFVWLPPKCHRHILFFLEKVAPSGTGIALIRKISRYRITFLDSNFLHLWTLDVSVFTLNRPMTYWGVIECGVKLLRCFSSINWWEILCLLFLLFSVLIILGHFHGWSFLFIWSLRIISIIGLQIYNVELFLLNFFDILVLAQWRFRNVHKISVLAQNLLDFVFLSIYFCKILLYL